MNESRKSANITQGAHLPTDSIAMPTWMQFEAGQRIRVNGRGPNDHSQKGRTGKFLEYVKTGHGYMARISLDPKDEWISDYEDRWILHPESLEVENG